MRSAAQIQRTPEPKTSESPRALASGPATQRLDDLQSAVDGSPPVARLTQLRTALNARSSHPPFSGGVVQLVRKLTEDDDPTLDALYDALDHFSDVLSFSSSIPPRLPDDFFPLFSKSDAALDEISETRQIDSDQVLVDLEAAVEKLGQMMDQAKERAAIDREATEPGTFRPPALLPNRPETKTTKAKRSAQELNEDLAEGPSHEDNLALLRAQKGATFYVLGFDAMGQGDTAFVVRTVNLLKGLGLNAIGVKSEKSAFAPGKSFASNQFITPEKMFSIIKSTDFLIEGPLSDPISIKDPSVRTHGQEVREKNPKLPEFRNLRLYEYGTLDHRGGQLQREQDPTGPSSKANVVNSASDPHHAFMGMGHGEIGAFYNSKSQSGPVDLPTVLAEHAKANLTTREILQAIKGEPDIYIGYANQASSVQGWATAVSQHIATTGKPALIIGLYGATKIAAPFKIDQSDTAFVSDRIDPNKKVEVAAKAKSTSRVIISDSVPAPVMNALQMVAQPFTLATGNFSLSEAIENGHFPIYETLPFNAGVETAFRGQVMHALEALQLTDTKFGRAVRRLTGAGPDTLAGSAKSDGLTATDAIGIVLAHPHDVKLLMAVIKANTDIAPALVARLANLARM